MSDVLLTEQRGRVLLGKMNRPDVHNALDSELKYGLADFWTRVQDDPDLDVAIVTGAGQKSFTAGRDLKESAATYATGQTLTPAEVAGTPAYPADHAIEKPIIAAINGYCFGAGLKLIMQCDLRIASTNALFSNPQAAVGRGSEVPLRLAKLGVPMSGVMDIALTGRRFDAAEALRWGIVSRVVDSGALLETAWSMAEQITKGASKVVRGTKKMLHDDIVAQPISQAMQMWKAEPGMFGPTEDAQAGALAYARSRDQSK